MTPDLDTPEPAGSARPAAPVLQRRGLIRHGAVLAGAAIGGAAVAAVSAPGVASAADGDNLLAGRPNETDSTTTITIGSNGGAEEPALSLKNANGPSLYLQPLDGDFAGTMGVGQVTNTVLGPVIGVDTLVGEVTTYLATGVDLADLPTPFAMPVPARKLDTRTPAGRAGVLRTSTDPYDASGRLKAGAWIDVEVSPAPGDYRIPSVYLNVVAVTPLAAGHLTVYKPGNYPGTSTLNYPAKQTTANLAFVATGIALGRYAVRIRVSGPTHVVADLTGFTVQGDAPVAQASGATKKAAAGRKPAEKARITSRLRSSLTERVRAAVSR